MQFIETRGNDGSRVQSVSFSDAILNPSASFGGLYVPESIPDIGNAFLDRHLKSSYKVLALDFLKTFEIDIEEEILIKALERYERFDDPLNPVPLCKIENDCFVSELYHGPTRAFKDMALQPFGYILSRLAEQRGEEYLVMAATSGDTGPATLETFKNKKNVRVVCLYPKGGTSDVQELQMVTEDAPNLKVIGVKGNFDDTQSALKRLLSSDDFTSELRERGIKLTAANSVNFGRIIFQIIYHIHAYLELVRKDEIAMGERVYLVVPSGNFGNALGAYYAKKAGLPIEKILISSNINNILTDWIQTGVYDLTTRSLIRTESPAMDILKSSNIERILFDKFGEMRTKELMESLDRDGKFVLTRSELSMLREDFDASFMDDDSCYRVIGKYAKSGYMMDTHTATCMGAYEELREKRLKTVIYSTAEWTKFSPAVAKALGKEGVSGDIEALAWVSEYCNVKVPYSISELFLKPVIHHNVVEKESIKGEMLDFL